MAEERWPRPKNYRPFAEDTAAQVEEAQKAQDDHKGVPMMQKMTMETGTLRQLKRKGSDTYETLPERKKGGPVKKGKEYLVGEAGVEKFVPKEDGKIIPNKKLRRPGHTKKLRKAKGRHGEDLRKMG